MASTKWYPPLPTGWEARWDPNQKAFFFINHANKTTTWEDPRIGEKQKLATLFTPVSKIHPDGESIPLSNISSTLNANHSSSPLSKETVFTKRDPHAAVVQRLKERFSSADKTLIGDILNSCGNDESSAASQLSDLGFQSSPDHKQKSHVHSTSSPKKSTLSPDHHALANHSKQQALKPVLTQDEKRQLINQLRLEYKDLEDEVVKMALEACLYNKDRVRETLDRISNKWKSHLAKPASKSKTHEGIGVNVPKHSSLTRTSHQQPVSMQVQSVSLEPAILQDKSTDNRTTKIPVIITQPVSQPTIKENKKHVHGPNSFLCNGHNQALCSGPDLTLQKRSLGQAAGPKPALYCGFIQNLSKGSQGAVGPNPLHCCHKSS